MKIKYILSALIISISFALAMAEEQISPFKLENFERPPHYEIPKSSRFTISHPNEAKPAIIYYLTKPTTQNNKQVPITIFVTGSSSKGFLYSVIHVHRYFLAEVLDVGSAMLTVEHR